MADTPMNEDTTADVAVILEELRQQNEQLIANSEALVESNAALVETVQQQTEQLKSLIEGVGLIFGAIVVTIVYNIFSRVLSVIDRA